MTKRLIAYIPSLYPNRVVYFTYRVSGGYAIRDFINPVKRGKTTEILPLIEKSIPAEFVNCENKEYWIAKLHEISKEFLNAKYDGFYFRKASNKAINENLSVQTPSDLKADKHIRISIEVKKIIEKFNSEFKTYLATYTASKTYQKLEEQSGEEFWSLRMYNSKIPDNASRAKYPDIIVIKDNMIKYVIEVKWGFIGNYTNSPDLMSIFDEAEMNKIKKMIDKSQVCRALGPKVYCGTRLNKNEEIDFFRSEETMFLLVSDFKGLYKKQRSIFEDFKDQFSIDYSDYIGRLIILDIHESVENIQSLDNYLK